MINSTNAATQSVAIGKNVLFSTDRVKTNSCKCACNGWLSHDVGSGLFTITKPGVYVVGFNANVSTAVAGTPIVLDLVNSGEVISGGEMIATPSTANAQANVSATILLQVPCNSSATIAVKNNSTATADVEQANLFILRKS